MTAATTGEGRDFIAALDPLLGVAPLPLQPAAAVLATAAVAFAPLVPPTVVNSLEDAAADVLPDEMLALSEQVRELWRNEVRVWNRTTGSGDAGDLIATVAAWSEQVLLHPQTFVDAFHEAMVATFTSQIVDTWEYLGGVARWALQMTRCSDAVEFSALRALAMEDWAQLELDDHACSWLREFVANTRKTLETTQQLWDQLERWGDVVAERPSIVLDALIVYQEFAIDVIDEVLADQTYYEWLQSHAKAGSESMGRLSGSITGFLAFQGLWMWVGGWVGDLGIVGRVLWEIVEAPLPSLPSQDTDNDDEDLQRPRPAATRGTGALPAGEMRARLVKYLEALGPEGRELLHVVTEAARKAQKRLSRRITDRRLRRIVEALTNHPELLAATKNVRAAVEQAMQEARWAYGRHGSLAQWREHINNGLNGLAYLDLIGEGRLSIDEAEALAESAAQLTRVVEAAHAIDQQHWPRVKPIFEKANIPWESTDDIWSMLMASGDHTGNPLRSLSRASGLGESALGSFDEHKSLTGWLNERVKWDVPVADQIKGKGFQYLDSNSSVDDVTSAFENIATDWGKDNRMPKRFHDRVHQMYDGIRALQAK